MIPFLSYARNDAAGLAGPGVAIDHSPEAIDRAIAHFRRYEMGELTAKLRDHGFEIAEARYFNLPGMIGWWVNSVLLKRRSVPGVQARIANLLVPWLRFESRLGLRRGMALLVVARRAVGTAVAAPFRVPESVAH